MTQHFPPTKMQMDHFTLYFHELGKHHKPLIIELIVVSSYCYLPTSHSQAPFIFMHLTFHDNGILKLQHLDETLVIT